MLEITWGLPSNAGLGILEELGVESYTQMILSLTFEDESFRKARPHALGYKTRKERKEVEMEGKSFVLNLT